MREKVECHRSFSGNDNVPHCMQTLLVKWTAFVRQPSVHGRLPLGIECPLAIARLEKRLHGLRHKVLEWLGLRSGVGGQSFRGGGDHWAAVLADDAASLAGEDEDPLAQDLGRACAAVRS